MVSLVSGCALVRPSTGGRAGAEPVEISAKRKAIGRPSTSIVRGPVNRAWPKRVSMPSGVSDAGSRAVRSPRSRRGPGP